MLKKKDVAFLISFGADSELLQDLTGSPRLLQEGLDHMKLNGGFSTGGGPVPTMNKARGTVLYDAVYLASNDILAHEAGRKAIILITDGEDEGSKLSEKEAIEAAQRSDAIIYGILYVDRQFYGGFGGGGYSGESVLKHMAEETGGRVFTVDRKNSLDNIFEHIQQEMRTQYAIGYTPTNSKKDGSFRKNRSARRRQGPEGPGAKGLLRDPSAVAHSRGRAAPQPLGAATARAAINCRIRSRAARTRSMPPGAFVQTVSRFLR